MIKPLQVICCYAHEDEQYLLKLKKHLSPLQRQGLIDVWHDHDISAGTEWEHEVSKHLSNAQVILLLVSPAFMDSEYCYSIEMSRAMERHEKDDAYVIPIVLRPVLWDTAPFRKLQALPSDAEPISSNFWHTEDHAFFDVAKGIRKMAQEFLKQLQDTFPSNQQEHTALSSIATYSSGNSIGELLQPLIKTPQCSWVVPWSEGYKVTNIELKYEDQPEAHPSHYKYTMQDDIRQIIADWGTKNEDNPKLKALRVRLEEQAEAVQVRVQKMGWHHYTQNAPKRTYKYVIWLAPTRYLYYDAIHANLGRNVQLRHLREKYFRNAFVDLDKNAPLELPSDFALHTAVVSRDGYLLLRQRTNYTEHYPLAWEAGVGEFMHGPGSQDVRDVDVVSDPGRSQLHHFRKNRTPALSLFLKNAIAEELGYREARQGDFRLYGFAVEHETLAPKLLAVYNSDCTIDTLLRNAKGEHVKDPARSLDKVELTPRTIAEAFSNPQYSSWEPKSKLVILLALKRDLDTKDMKAQSLEVEKLIDRFKPDTLLSEKEPDDPWQFHN